MQEVDAGSIGPEERRALGLAEGVYSVPPDFDAPLPEDVLGDFEDCSDVFRN